MKIYNTNPKTLLKIKFKGNQNGKQPKKRRDT